MKVGNQESEEDSDEVEKKPKDEEMNDEEYIKNDVEEGIIMKQIMKLKMEKKINEEHFQIIKIFLIDYNEILKTIFITKIPQFKDYFLSTSKIVINT